ncbi:hypothetical protein F444_19418 [Phytophthora nicotianae P1976]|uniref:HAT C-terminal dimerisation domain-containing protein n=1 Tax=Phytophthora nicotianae P1976 TaxID=1317066 RepID=A0A080Z7W3_PHYNI|nr:hypothetical protein F444_19418 [Phytophthora nicotianae P1976]
MLRHHVFQWCRNSLYIGESDYISYDEFPSAQAFWSYAKGKSPGPNLPDLVLAVLPIAANTATCEQRFSAISRIHTRTRNCIKAGKTNKAAIISEVVRQRDREASKREGHGDDEVVEEDGDGNKFVGRIVKSAERPVKWDSWLHAAPRKSVGFSIEADGGLTVTSTDNSATQQPVPNCSPESQCPQFLTHVVHQLHGQLGFHSQIKTAQVLGVDQFQRSLDARTIHYPVHPTSNQSIGRCPSNIDLPPMMPVLRPTIFFRIGAKFSAKWTVLPPPTPSSEDFDMHEEDEEELNVQFDESQLRVVPIPEDNDPRFAQESRKLPGLRGRKMPLVELFSMQNTL